MNEKRKIEVTLHPTITIIIGAFLFFFGLGWLFIFSHFISGHWNEFFAALAGFILIYIGSRDCKLGLRQRQVLGEDLLAKDKRSPILYLRSFKSDNANLLNLFNFELDSFLNPFIGRGRTLVEYLIPRIRKFGPVVALGRSNEKLQPFGASRIYEKNDTWKKRYHELINKAQLILMVLDDSESLRWELEQIVRMRKLSKTVIILSPKSYVDPKYKNTFNILSILPDVPHIDKKTIGLTFTSDGMVTVYNTKKRTIKNTMGFINDYINNVLSKKIISYEISNNS